MGVTVGGVYANALREDVHAAREHAWTRNKRVCKSYSAGSMVRVAMVISIILWLEDRGGGGAAIASIGCTCTIAPKVEARSCGRRSAEERRSEWGSTKEHRGSHCPGSHRPHKSQRAAPRSTFQLAPINTL